LHKIPTTIVQNGDKMHRNTWVLKIIISLSPFSIVVDLDMSTFCFFAVLNCHRYNFHRASNIYPTRWYYYNASM